MKEDIARTKARYVKRMMERTKESPTTRAAANRAQSVQTRIRIFESIRKVGDDNPPEERRTSIMNVSRASRPEQQKKPKFSPPEIRIGGSTNKCPGKDGQGDDNKENEDPNEQRWLENDPKKCLGGDGNKENEDSNKQRRLENDTKKCPGEDENTESKDPNVQDCLENDSFDYEMSPVKSPNRWDQDKINRQIHEQSRVSVGKYFKAKSQKDLLSDFHEKSRDTDEENAELYRRESNKLCGSGVPSVFEPEVDDRRQSRVLPTSQRRRSEVFLPHLTVEEDTDDEQEYDVDFHGIVETPVRTFGLESEPSKFKEVTKYPTLDELTPAMSFFREPDHESTRRFNERTITVVESSPQISDKRQSKESQTKPSPGSYMKLQFSNFSKDSDNLVSPKEKNVPAKDTASPEDDRKYNVDEDSILGLKTPANRTSSNINNKTFMSEVSQTEPKNLSKLNRTRSICRTLTRKFARSFLGTSRKIVSPSRNLMNRSDLNPNRQQKYDELRRRAEIEEDRVLQAQKALETCKSSRRFVSSQERVEAERFLILTTMTKSALSSELARFACNDIDDGTGLYCERGTVTLSDFSLILREELVRLRQSGDQVEWFIIVVRSGLTVWASHAVPCPLTSPLYFPGEISIPDLGPDFRISVTVYSTNLEQVVVKHEVKYGTLDASDARRSFRKRICFGKSKDLFVPQSNLDKSRKHSFTPCGNVDFTLFDLKESGPWTLTGVPSSSVLQGNLRLNIKCDLQLSVTHAGFLTYASDAFLLSYDGEESLSVRAWNRRWCSLKGQSLLLWNYPDEQETHLPIFSIDLAKCVSEQVSAADRTICARSKTLIVETCWRKNDADCQTNCSHTRHLLCFDNKQDLTEWQSKLNHVISSLQQWSVIRPANGLSSVSI